MIIGGIHYAPPLQPVLAAASAPHPQEQQIYPHHPICCPGEIRYEEDGTFRCNHAAVGPRDRRTQICLDHTIAALIIEEAVRRFR